MQLLLGLEMPSFTIWAVQHAKGENLGGRLSKGRQLATFMVGLVFLLSGGFWWFFLVIWHMVLQPD